MAEKKAPVWVVGLTLHGLEYLPPSVLEEQLASGKAPYSSQFLVERRDGRAFPASDLEHAATALYIPPIQIRKSNFPGLFKTFTKDPVYKASEYHDRSTQARLGNTPKNE